MTVYKNENGNWTPAEPVSYKWYLVYKAGWPSKNVKKYGKWYLWIGPYQIGWSIP